MAKQIKFEYNGESYTLEFTRRTVELMEKQGFKINELPEKPVSTLPKLFAGAFICHHPRISQDTVNAIYKRLPNKESLVAKLGEMYSEPIAALMDEPEDNEGNVNWGASW